MSELQTIKSVDDYLKGQKDCKEGLPAKQDGSEDYQRGYSIQYQHEANMDAIFGESNEY